MKLWLIAQTVNDGYDTYDSAVVAAETEEAAVMIHPGVHPGWDGKDNYTWASADKVEARLIGEALLDTEAGVICASFNAG